MRPLFLLASAIISLAFSERHAMAAFATVNVHWNVEYQTQSGKVIRSSPSAAYLQTLRSCGFRAEFSTKTDNVPLRVLRCPGVLNFSLNASLRSRVDQRIQLAQSHGHKSIGGVSLASLRAALSRLDFGISPFGVFFSDRDGLGTNRLIALNVEQQRLVILNKIYWAQHASSENADAFLLHEVFGALGLGDTDYQLSTALFGMSKTKHEEGDGDEAADLPAIRIAESGGGSVVGRGGDFTQMLFKTSLLLAANNEPAGLTKAELKRIINQAPVTTAPASFFSKKPALCAVPGSGKVSKFYCGSFALKGVDGRPFLLITQEWGAFSEADKKKLVKKIFDEIVSQLAKAI